MPTATATPPRRAIVLGQTALAFAPTTDALPLGEGFAISVNGLTISGRPTYEQCAAIGRLLPITEKGIQFAIGDFLNYVEDALGEQASQIVDASEGWSESTVSVYRYVARSVTADRRRMDRLTFTHHQVVAALPARKQAEWLTRAAADDEDAPWTVARLKAALAEGGDLPASGWWVTVECKDEEDQAKLVAKMAREGRNCKATTRRRRQT